MKKLGATVWFDIWLGNYDPYGFDEIFSVRPKCKPASPLQVSYHPCTLLKVLEAEKGRLLKYGQSFRSWIS